MNLKSHNRLKENLNLHTIGLLPSYPQFDPFMHLSTQLVCFTINSYKPNNVSDIYHKIISS
ncbi:hypothetical protein Hanom_Chr12g01156371 [Helianthus anomalus]